MAIDHFPDPTPPEKIDPADKLCGTCDFYCPRPRAPQPGMKGGPQNGFCFGGRPTPIAVEYLQGVKSIPLRGEVGCLYANVGTFYPAVDWHYPACGEWKKRKGKALEAVEAAKAAPVVKKGNGAIEPLPPPRVTGDSSPIPANDDIELPGEHPLKPPAPETKQ